MKTKKRSLVSLLLLIMVFVFSLGVASCKKGGGDDDADSSSSSTVDYAEEGVYYFNAVDNQEYLVTLDGDTFTMWLGGEMKNGQYTYDGNNLNLAFAGTDTATATLSDGVLSLTYNGNAYRFLKKINYTVTYHTNGGSEVAAATVLNGQTLAKPADPQLSGYTFISWYKDAEYTMPFAFGTEPVTSNMTLYARFAETVVGGNEYVATLNVDGAQYATQSTIGGVLYDLPTPQKDGAVFAGWWVSVDGDATKLSYKYVDQTLAANASLYGVWVSAAPAVSVSATGVSWSVQTAASAYRVKITAPNGDIVYNREVGSTNVEYDFASGVAGTYTVEVTANDNTSTVYYANKTLDKVSLFSVSEPSVLLFNAVENAEKYLIKIVCGNESHVHTAVDNGLSTNYNFSNCEMCPGGIQFQVTAVAKGYANSVSDVYSYSRDLAAVTGLTLDAAADKITWNPVAGATSYVVEIVKGETSTKVEVTSTSYTLQNYTGEMTIKVTPVAKAYNSPEAVSVAYAKTKLVTPTNVLLSKNTLKWTAVDGAVKYVVSFNGTTYESTTNELALTSDMYVDGQESYQVSVQAVAADAVNNSAFSAAVTINYSVMNPELSYSKGVVSWSSVANAYRYAVRVNKGREISVKGEFNSCPVTLTKAGNNTIEVRYYDEDERGSDWVSITVYAYSITFDACGGAEVKTQYKALGDPIELPKSTLEGYNFTAWYNVPNGPENNGAIFNDTTLTTSGNMILYAYWSYESYTVLFDLDEMGVLDVDSLDVGYNREFVLPVPVANNPMYIFGGWYSSPNGRDIQYTDEYGTGLRVWQDTKTVTAYAHWISVLNYKKQKDSEGVDFYAVSANMKYIDRVSSVKIPATYQGEDDAEAVPVKRIDADAFKSCKKLESIQIPDTIMAIVLGTYGLTGTGSAFNSCTSLQNLTIYCVYGDHEANDHVTYYKSENGALIYSDPTNPKVQELLYVPAAVEGVYTIPQGITSLAPYLFYYNTSIQEVKIPASVTYIGAKAFYRAAAKVTFIKATEADLVQTDPKDETKKELPLLRLGEQVFWYTTHTEITLPARLSPEDFNVNIFEHCDKLEKVIIQPEEVECPISYKTTADGMLLQVILDKNNNPTAEWKVIYCPKAKKGAVTFPVDVTEIGAKAFYNCDSITSVAIPYHMTKLGAQAFYSCEALTTLTIDENVENFEIRSEAFSGCTQLGNFTIPSGVTTIGAKAFYNCSSITSLTIPVTVTTIGESAFARSSYNAEGGISSITFEDEENSKALTIGKEAFKFVNEITTLTIPARVTSIGDGAFQGIIKLESVTFVDPDGAEQNLTIEANAFKNCDNLTEITLPARLKSLGACAFGDTNKLTTVNVNSKAGVTLANYAFGSRTDSAAAFYVTTLNLGVNAPGNIALTSVFGTKLNTVNVAEGNTSLKSVDGVLYDDKITTVLYYPDSKTGAYTLPDTIEVITAGVFKGKSFESITFGYKLTEIGESAFENCKNLKNIYFTATPDGTEPVDLTIGVSAFDGCVALENFQLPTRTVSIGEDAFMGCKALTAVVIPEGVKTIGGRAFSGCDNVVTVSLPSTLEEIRVIPTTLDTVTSGPLAGYRATYFYAFNCDSLQSITVDPDNNYYASIDGVLYKKAAIDTVTYSDGKTKKELHVEKDDTATASETTGSESTDGEDGTDNTEPTEENRVTSYVPYELLQVPFRKTGKVTIPNTVSYIADYAFGIGMETSDVTEVAFSGAVDLPEGVELTFGLSAFYSEKLTKITLPTGLKKIDVQDFEYCMGLKEIFIPNTVTSIGARAFSRCKALETITFEEATQDSNYELRLEDGTSMSTTSSGTSSTYYGVFVNTQSPYLTTITLPARTTYIGTYAFFATAYESSGQYTTLERYPYLQSITIPANVTEIGARAFGYQEALTNVQFAEDSQLTKINENAFYYCSKLQSISFANVSSLKEIGANAFNSTGLSGELTLPTGLETVQNGAFSGLKITKVTISNTVVTLNQSAFANNKLLTEVVFEATSKLETIGKSAFSGCTKLATIQIPASVKSIGESAFSSATSLTSLPFAADSALEEIGASAFANTGLTSFEFPVTSAQELALGAALFSGCKSLTTVTLSKSVTKISGVLTKCAALKTVIVESDNENFLADKNLPILYNKVEKEDDQGNTIYIYTTIQFSFGEIDGDTYKVADGVTIIGANAFEGQGFKKIEFPKSLLTIEASAFKNCRMLEEVVFAEGCNLETIGDYAFQLCTSLKGIELPAGVKTIGKAAFQGCQNMETLDLGDNLVTIHESAFDTTPSLSGVTFPDTLTGIGKYAFRYSGISGKVIIPENVEKLVELNADGSYKTSTSQYSMTSYTFQYCTNITEVELPDSLTHIAGYAFDGCISLRTINFPEGLEYISNYAFRNCRSLTTVALPDSMKDIGNNVFENCTSLTTANVPNLTATGTTPRYTYMYKGCTALSKVTFNSSITKLANYMFQNCTSLTSVELPTGLTALGNYLFAGSGLTSFDFTPLTSLTAYPTNLFQDCTSLSSVTFDPNSTIKSLGNYMFAGCTALKSINLPAALTYLGTYTFQGSGLESITIPAKVTMIGTSATAASASSAANTFENCVNLKTVSATHITKMSKAIFKGCTSLESIDLPNLTQLGNENFMNSGLKSINLPKVTNLPTSAFEGCTQLGTATFAAAISSASGSYVFRGCTALTSVDFGTKITATSLGSSFFEGCTSLKGVTLPSKLTALPAKLFYGCTNLESIEIPANVASITNTSMSTGSSYIGAFSGCTKLSSVNFAGNKLTKLGGDGTFQDCISLTSITLPSSLQYISYNTFKDSGITSINLPASVRYVYPGAFAAENLSTITVDAANPYMLVGGDGCVYSKDGSTLLAVPTAMEGVLDLSNTTITTLGGGVSAGGSVFAGNTKITRVLLPDTLETINNYAFQNMTGLLNIEIPASVTTIGQYAFDGCTALRNFSLAEGSTLATIGSYAFRNTPTAGEASPALVLPEGIAKIETYTFDNSGFTAITLPSTLTTIGTYAFRSSGVKNITIPANVTSIGTNAFEASALKTFTFATIAEKEEGVAGTATIGDKAFLNATALTTVVLPEGVAKLGASLFQGCTALTTVNVPTTVTEFGASVFEDAISLTAITLPNGVTKFGNYAFRRSGLLEIELPATVTALATNGMFMDCKALTRVVLPEGLTSIANYTFQGCSALTEVNIPETVTTLSQYAFDGCTSLATVTLPEGLTGIGNYCFQGCSAMTKIIIPSTVTSMITSPFNGWNSTQTIYLRSARVDMHKTWNCVTATQTVDGISYGYVKMWSDGCDANFVYNYVGN